MKKKLLIVLSLILAITLVGCNLELAKSPIFPEQEEAHGEGISSGFGGGNGTAENPYLIANATHFRALGSESFQSRLLEGNNDDLYFKLTNDIDLRDQVGRVAWVISGTLDGDGHSIYCSNNMPFIFSYFLEDTTFKDFTVVFGDNEISRLFAYPAVVSPKGTSINSEGYHLYDKETITLNMIGVDYRPSNTSRYYTVGDANFSFYSGAHTSVVYVINEGRGIEYTYFPYLSLSEEDYKNNTSSYKINIEDCHMTGNYIGGFSNSGAAIFISGQIFGTDVTIKNSSFNGNLVGRRVALVAANPSWCNTGSITTENVSGYTITSYEGLGSLQYGYTHDDAVQFTVDGEYKKETPNININVPIKDTVVTATTTGDVNATAYEVKFSLPTVYWYLIPDTTKWYIQTNSNTITFAFDSLEELNNANLKAVKVVARDELIAQGKDDGIKWDDAKVSLEGRRYIFAEIDGADYLVLDYGDPLYKFSYSDSGFDTPLENHPHVKSVLVLAHAEDGHLAGMSSLVTVN